MSTDRDSCFAHSLPGKPQTTWERLGEHHAAVGDRAHAFAAQFGWAELGRVAGGLHDIGKCAEVFQAYIKGRRERGGDHSSAGAIEARALYPGFVGQALAFCIAGHHAGLADGVALDDRLAGDLNPYPDWRVHTGEPPPLSALAPTRRVLPEAEAGFGKAFLIRMLFSCLVDADFLETERFYAHADGQEVLRGGYLDLDTLRLRLTDHMAKLTASARPTALNILRGEILQHVTACAPSRPACSP